MTQPSPLTMAASRFLAAAALLMSFAAEAKSPKLFQRPVNVSLTDNSPLLSYSPPPGDPAADNYVYNASLWNATFSDVPWSAWKEGRLGKGRSAHGTNTSGSQVSITWIGTEVYFLGSCDQCKLGLTVSGGDEQEFSPSFPGEDVLAMHTDPGASVNVENTATLVLKEGRIAFSGVRITSLIPTYA